MSLLSFSRVKKAVEISAPLFDEKCAIKNSADEEDYKAKMIVNLELFRSRKSSAYVTLISFSEHCFGFRLLM